MFLLLSENLVGRLHCKLNFKRCFKKIKGSPGTPFFYLGVVSVILFGLVSLGSGSFSGSFCDKEDFSLAAVSNALENDARKDLFLDSRKKIWPDSPEFLLVEGCSLQAASPLATFSPQVLGALIGGAEPEDAKRVITEYIIEPGDSLTSIAEKFDISLNTIFWANNLSKNSQVKSEQRLIILPVSGVVHHVKAGETISEIAEMYKGKTQEMVAFNGLSGEGDIYVGDIIVIPDGVPTLPVAPYKDVPNLIPLANSYFICPLSSPCQVTQGLHWYSAVDFSHGKCGEPIYAAAAGKVLKVKLTDSTSRTAFYGTGNHLTILHSNGVVTMYGHITASLVSPGQEVSQGQIIALVGGQPGTPGAGLSTGCHLHFGVTGAVNLFAK